MSKEFFTTLFKAGEGICVSNNTYGTTVITRERNAEYKEQFFCINPLNAVLDLERGGAPRRADCNVTSFRNILIEFDKIPLTEQRRLIKESGIPYTSQVFSGSKSIHVIISLVTPLESKEAYKALAKRIYDKLGGKSIVDTSVSNPSRFSRVPGALRDGVEQTLIELKEKVPLEALLEWLGPEAPKPVPVKGPQLKRILNSFTLYFLFAGAKSGEWNSTLFKASADMTRAGYSKDEIIDKVESINGYLTASDKRTIESAIRVATKDL